MVFKIGTIIRKRRIKRCRSSKTEKQKADSFQLQARPYDEVEEPYELDPSISPLPDKPHTYTHRNDDIDEEEALITSPPTSTDNISIQEDLRLMTPANATSEAPTTNTKLLAWVEEIVDLCNPESVYWCDGSQEEYDKLAQFMTENGPNSLVVMAQDVAPDTVVENLTDSLIRRYMNRGGAVIWNRDTPFAHIGRVAEPWIDLGANGLQDVLDVQAGVWDLNDSVQLTVDANALGL